MAQKNVALVYHFFAHYRRPVLEELLAKSKHHFLLCADTENALMPGVTVWTPEDPARFRECRCFSVRTHLVWQTGLVALALDHAKLAIHEERTLKVDAPPGTRASTPSSTWATGDGHRPGCRLASPDCAENASSTGPTAGGVGIADWCG